MIDAHCHLAAPEFADDREAVLRRAFAAGVHTMIVVGDTLEESAKAIELATASTHVFATAGIHPHHASSWNDDTERDLRLLLSSGNRVKAVGEIGLDYHYNFSLPDVQRIVFERQLWIARELSLPAVVHCRDAISDVQAILDRVRHPRIQLHCCTEAWDDVAPLVEASHFLSFTGIVTYPNATAVRDTVRHCPLAQMMIETDSPYLAPVPHRGKRNEPAYVAEVLRAVATIKGMDITQVETELDTATRTFFDLPA